MGEDPSVGEGLHELAAVRGIGGGAVVCGGEVAAGMAIDEHHFDGSGWVPGLFEKVQVCVHVFGADRDVHGDEVLEDFAGSDCSKTMKGVSEGSNVD